MSNIENFSWTWTELITPFLEDWNIDFEAFDTLIEMQINAWVKWISFLWITWESPTLTRMEKFQIIKRWVNKIKWRCFIMVSVWTNSTNETIDLIKEYDEISWIDAFSVVVPYYNKPTQEWIYKHFEVISQSTQKRIFIYNNPSRTGTNLESDTLIRLSNRCYNIIWIKESSWDLEQIKDILDNKKDDFVILSWFDYLNSEMIRLWAHWVISTASNIFPNTIVSLTKKSLQQEFDEVKEINNSLNDFFTWEFLQINPLPIKYALSEVWLIKEVYRLPLCSMDDELKKKWIKILHNYSELT